MYLSNKVLMKILRIAKKMRHIPGWVVWRVVKDVQQIKMEFHKETPLELMAHKYKY
jgi:ribosomal protein L39E